MKKINKNYLNIVKNILFIIFYLLFSSNNSYALQITEIMYDPDGADTGREWIEIYNDTGSSINIANYKLNESVTSGGTGSNNTITGTDTLSTHSYAVIVEDIAKFKLDYPSYTGALYKASYGPLSNSAGIFFSMRIRSSTSSPYTISSEYNYDYFAKNSSFVSGHSVCNANVESGNIEWHECSPTPGAINAIVIGGLVENPSDTGMGSDKNASSTASSTSSTPYQASSVPIGISYYVPNPNLYIKVGDMTVESIKDKNVMSGIDFNLTVRAYNQNGTAVSNPKYYWSMGDGGYFEGEKVKYVYHIPGNYEFTVEAGNDNSYSMYRGSITVLEPKLSITEASTTSNQIKIKNEADGEIDIGGIILRDNINNKVYKIARNTFIKSKKELKLNGDAVGFVSTSSDNFSLLAANGYIINQYIRPKLIITNPSTSTASDTNRNTNSISSVPIVNILKNKIITPLSTSSSTNTSDNKSQTIYYRQKLSFYSHY